MHVGTYITKLFDTFVTEIMFGMKKYRICITIFRSEIQDHFVIDIASYLIN